MNTTANQALHLTVIPLRSIAAGERSRSDLCFHNEVFCTVR